VFHVACLFLVYILIGNSLVSIAKLFAQITLIAAVVIIFFLLTIKHKRSLVISFLI